MFLIMGINPAEKKLDFGQTAVCPRCGKFGRYEIIMTYMCFNLFFIPLFKWNKRYYVKTTCCNSFCEISNELGQQIARGEVTQLNENDLHISKQDRPLPKQCGCCGYTTDEDFQFCPKCGRPL